MIDELEKQTIILSEILKWTKVGNIGKVRDIIQGEFQEENKFLAYSLSDGKSSADIETIINKKVDRKTIRNWWRKWDKLGLMEDSPNFKKRLTKSFDLEDFDIKVPKVAKKEVKIPVSDNSGIGNLESVGEKRDEGLF